MGLNPTKANSDGLNRVFRISIYFSNVNFENFFEYIHSTLFN